MRRPNRSDGIGVKVKIKPHGKKKENNFFPFLTSLLTERTCPTYPLLQRRRDGSRFVLPSVFTRSLTRAAPDRNGAKQLCGINTPGIRRE